MAVRKPGDAIKAKERKQKIFVAIGAVGLLAAAAFEVPMLMKQGGGGGGTPPPAQTAAAPAGSTAPTSLAPPTPSSAGTTTTAAAAAGGRLVDTDVLPQASQTQLVGFSLFAAKDPFVQQVTAVERTAPSASSASGSTPAADGSAAAGGKADKAGADVPAGESAVPKAPTSSAPAGSGEPVAQTVTIAVNGKREVVGKGGTFPEGSPTFRLVSFGKGSAEIGVVGGSYAAGGETVTLKQGVPLTLVNTTDDTRYRLELVRTP